jgi:hypothetical protein
VDHPEADVPSREAMARKEPIDDLTELPPERIRETSRAEESESGGGVAHAVMVDRPGK